MGLLIETVISEVDVGDGEVVWIHVNSGFQIPGQHNKVII